MLQDVGSLVAKVIGGPAKTAAKSIRIKAVKYGFKEPDISYTFLGIQILVVATPVPSAGRNKIPSNFNRLLGQNGLGEIIRFDHFVEMEIWLFNKWLEL